jgi:hypothetical protein
MVEPARRPIELDRQRGAGRDAGSQAKEQSQTKAVSNAEQERIRNRPRNQPQRTVLPAQQIISKVEGTQHVTAGASNANRRDCVMVHYFLALRVPHAPVQHQNCNLAPSPPR